MQPNRGPAPLVVILVIVILVIGFSGSVVVGQDVTLRYRWTTGETLRYRSVEETQAVTSGLPGIGEMTVTSVITQIQQLTAEDIGVDGVATVRATIESMKVDLSTPAGRMAYDSAAPSAATDPMAAPFALVATALVGHPVFLTIDPAGGLRTVTGATELGQRIRTASPEAAEGMASMGLGAMMSDEGLKGSFGGSFANLPQGPVRTGGTWQTTRIVPNAVGTTTVVSTFALKTVETREGRAIATIDVRQNVQAAEGGMIGPMSVSIGESSGRGEIRFDATRGRLLLATSLMTIPMSMTMTLPDGNSMTANSTSTTKLTMELVER